MNQLHGNQVSSINPNAKEQMPSEGQPKRWWSSLPCWICWSTLGQSKIPWDQEILELLILSPPGTMGLRSTMGLPLRHKACDNFTGVAAAPYPNIHCPVTFELTRAKKQLLLEYDWGSKACLFPHMFPHVGLENSKFLLNLQKGNQRTSSPWEPYDYLATSHREFRNWRKQLLVSESFSYLWPAHTGTLLQPNLTQAHIVLVFEKNNL